MVATVSLIVAVACAILLLLAFPAYAPMLRLAARWRRPREAPAVAADEDLPAVTLIISAFNEEDVIAEKLDNALALSYPRERLSVLVVSDASSDRTDDIVREYAGRDPRVRLLRQEDRLGKTMGLNAAMREVTTPLVVFSDANAMYEADAIRHLTAPFADEELGYVVGAALYTDAPRTEGGRTEGRYWSREQVLKQLESRVSSVVGGDGAIYATRSSLWEPLLETDINDFVHPMLVVLRGYRGVFEPRARCWEETTGSLEKELRRKRRIVNRSFSGLVRTRGVLNPLRFGWFSIQVWLHKVLRWFSPFLAATALVATTVAGFWHPAAAVVAGLGWVVSLAAALCLAKLLPMPSWFTGPVFAFGVSVASLLGIVDRLRGRVATTWATRVKDPEASEPPRAAIVWTSAMLALLATVFASPLFVPAGPWRLVPLIVSFIGMVGPFLIYPPLVRLRARRRAPPAPETEQASWPSVTLLVAAYNEEKVIREKIENSLEIRYPGPLDVVIASDGSTDATDRIALEYGERGVRLWRNESRTGKAGLLRRVVESLKSDVIVFSDANAFYDPSAVEALARRLSDPQIGAVTGSVRLVDHAEGAQSEEAWLSRLEKETVLAESRHGSCVGVDGAMVAVRRELVPSLRDGTILDDFAIAMAVANRGFRVVFEPGATGWERSVATLSGEYERRARILAGIVQLYSLRTGLPTSSSGLLGRFLGHKVWRWFAPGYSVAFVLQWLLMLGLVPGIAVLAGAAATAYLLLTVARGYRTAALKLGYLFVYQAAALAGLWRGFARTQNGAWRRTER